MTICVSCGTDVVDGDCGCNQEEQLRRQLAFEQACLTEVVLQWGLWAAACTNEQSKVRELDRAFQDAEARGAEKERERIRALGPFTAGPATSLGDQDRCDVYNLAFEAGIKYVMRKVESLLKRLEEC